jgi:RNA-directed DNA polymerase
VRGKLTEVPREICRGPLKAREPDDGLGESRDDLKTRQKSAEGIVGASDRPDRPGHSPERGETARGCRASSTEGPNGTPKRGLQGEATVTQLMSDERSKNRKKPAPPGTEDGSPKVSGGETEAPKAEREHEGPVETSHLMEEVCERENLLEALRHVRANKGSAGVDGMTVDELPGYLKEHWLSIRVELMGGKYRPSPVRRVEIEKPDGGVRKLGIPTVVDRFIQQALLQVLQPRWDPTFSEHSYGFRPQRSAHQAVAQAQGYICAGYDWVVDLDLEKFFDRVNHDRLMYQIARRVEDKRVLKLIRAFLNAGVLEGGLVSPTEEGTPQGGPLSPLLSNVVLDELDRELEKRGLRFVRYADDCNIYVRSQRSAERVMESVKRFISERLKLKVNESKSAAARPHERKFLGFSFLNTAKHQRCIAPKALERFKNRIRELTRGLRSRHLERAISEDLAPYLRGWRSYFAFCETQTLFRDLDGWIRRRLRCGLWRQWARPRKRVTELVKRGVDLTLAKDAVFHIQGPWQASRSRVIAQALPNRVFEGMGLPALWNVRP